MADSKRASVQFRESVQGGKENTENGLQPSQPVRKISSSSRFQVDRVNSIDAQTDLIENQHGFADATDADRLNNDSCPSPDTPSSPSGKSGYESQSGDSGTRSPDDMFYLQTNNSASYETNCKTFGRYTTEALPHVDHYRNLLSATTAMKSRPTLAELHEEKDESDKREPLLAQKEKMAEEGAVDKKAAAPKFGWIKGVLIRCLLNIWGVMLFMRLSWVVGQAGIGLASVIILLASVVTVITSLSMSAICTNGEIRGGGAYFMISRSLGPEFGGAIGLIFSVANAVAVAMYVVGFAETVGELLKKHDMQMVDDLNDIRIIGVITVTFLTGIAVVGMEWEARAQFVLLFSLLLAVANFIVGTFIPPTEAKLAKGYVGYRGDVFVENFGPKFEGGESFFSVFAVFFPAATGILAGANISGDLKNAQRDIPRGTFLAIVISSLVYLGIAWLLGGCLLREASGYLPVEALASLNVTDTSDVLYNMPSAVIPPEQSVDMFTLAKNCSLGIDNRCSFGLLHDYQSMEMASGFGPLVTVGIFSATLSSALASLVSAPKVFQAVCKDKIFPKVHFFAKGYGAGDNPFRAYILAYIIGVAFVCIGDLNAIAPIISNFFLMSYALINYSCFDGSLARSPGWRPAFRYYSMWLSLMGACLCIAVMFIINWWTALITFAVVATLFVYVHYARPDVNWGSSSQAHVYRSALQSTLKLLTTEDHIKNFRPNILVMTGAPDSRPDLVDFVFTLTRKVSLMVCGHVMIGSQASNLKQLRNNRSLRAYNWLRSRKIKAFYTVTTSPNFRLGTQSLLQVTGVGKLRPNIMIMGFMSNWRKVNDPQEVEDYVNIIHDAFDLEYGVGILHVQGGFYKHISYDDSGLTDSMEQPKKRNDFDDDDDFEDGDEKGRSSIPGTPTMLRRDSGGSQQQTEASTPEREIEGDIEMNNMSQSSDITRSVHMFSKKQKKGTIDVWWLFDDGGLTLLLPYILTLNPYWSNCKLRIFFAGSKRGEIDREQRQLATLLNKFRIDYKSMEIIPDVGKSPSEESMAKFEERCEGWMLGEDEDREKYPWKISEEDKILLQDKTKRNVRLRELLDANSKNASLVVMTLPIPRKGTCPAGLYMAWVETLTQDMPPILLLRGNQTSVLTFYS